MKNKIFPFIYGIGIILIGALLTSILYYFNVTTDKLNSIFLYSVSILSFFVGSLKLGKELKYKGLVTGLIYFAILFVFMVFLSNVIFKENFSIKNVIYYLVLLIFSILGGVIGKNMKEEIDA